MREMTLDDLDFVSEMLAHPEVMRYWPKPYSREESEEWIRKQIARYERDGHGYWLLSQKETGKPIGQAGLLMSEVDGEEQPAIGYILHRPYWNKGYATEAATAVRDWALEKYPRIIVLIRPENEPSLRVAERIGARLERTTMFANFEHLVYTCSKT